MAHIDAMPTLASAAGAALPEDRVIDGVNVLPLTRPGGEQDWRQTLFGKAAITVWCATATGNCR